MDFLQGKVTNKYLSEMEQWEETKVANYDKKVKVRLMAPWAQSFLFLGIYGSITMLFWALSGVLGTLGLGSVFNILSSFLVTLVLIAAFVLTSVIFGLRNAVRDNQKFVVDNRGEVGHSGRKYSRGIARGLIISIVVAAVAVLGVLILDILYYVDGEDFGGSDFLYVLTTFASMDLLGTLSCIIGAAVYPLVYHVKSVGVLKSFDKDTCPVCGRSNYRLVKQAVRKAEDEVLSKQVAYTPGKIAHVYGQFIIDKTLGNPETDRACYITYCRYCSFYIKGNGTENLAPKED